MSWIDKKEIKVEEVDVDYIITQYNGDLRNNATDFVKLEIVENKILMQKLNMRIVPWTLQAI